MQASATVATPANTNSQGFYLISRTSSTLLTLYKNGSSAATSVVSDTGNLPTASVRVMALFNQNNSTTNGYSSRNLAFATIGAGLNGTEAAALSTAVATYQTSLSRNV
jgi:hypothetical protein